ncbi:MAG: DUF4258 domain-containing protein [Desulfobacterales bacterium]|nr:DUF4258 domain-containing protein [Desulfobacterales bacterium]
MMDNIIITPNPLEFIKRCVHQRKLLWTYHVNMRLKNRRISRDAIIESFPYYEIIEEYPNDKYFPSYLVYSKYKNIIFHVLFAIDVQGDNARIITAYLPNPDEWENNFKKRK